MIVTDKPDKPDKPDKFDKLGKSVVMNKPGKPVVMINRMVKRTVVTAQARAEIDSAPTTNRPVFMADAGADFISANVRPATTTRRC